MPSENNFLFYIEEKNVFRLDKILNIVCEPN